MEKRPKMTKERIELYVIAASTDEAQDDDGESQQHRHGDDWPQLTAGGFPANRHGDIGLPLHHGGKAVIPCAVGVHGVMDEGEVFTLNPSIYALDLPVCITIHGDTIMHPHGVGLIP